jgi:hypothetical protein
MQASTKVSRGVFGALMIGALGFGATQVMAAPAAAESGAYCTREDAAQCTLDCQAALGSGWRGRCTVNSLGQKSCQCIQFTFPSS